MGSRSEEEIIDLRKRLGLSVEENPSWYEDWRDRSLVEEEGVADCGYYCIYRDSVRKKKDPKFKGYPTTGHGVRLTETEAKRFGGVGGTVPKEWLDPRAEKVALKAWNDAGKYMEDSGIPDTRVGRKTLASMNYQLGPKWYKDFKKTDKFLKAGKYAEAGQEVWYGSSPKNSSEWATQTPKRVRTASNAMMHLAGQGPLPPQQLTWGKHKGKFVSATGDLYSAALAGDPVAIEMMEEAADEERGFALGGLIEEEEDLFALPSHFDPDIGLPGRSVPEPEPDPVYRSVLLPDGSSAEVHPDVSDADALRRLSISNPERFAPPPQARGGDGDSNVFEAFGAGATRSTLGLWPGAQAFLATLTGDEEGYDRAQAELSEISDAARDIAPDLVTTEEIGNIYDNEGLIPAVAKSIEFGAEQIFSSFGFQAPALAMAGAAYLAAPFVAVPAASAAMVAGIGMMFSNYLSENMERGYEEGKIDTDDVEVLKVMAASGGQAALDSLSYMLAGGTAFLSAGGKKAFWSSATELLENLDKLGPMKRMLATIAEEEVAEVGQQALERFAAGLPVSPTDEDAAREYVQIMLATLAPSIGFSGMGSASSAWTKTKARRAEDGIQKARGDHVEVVRAADSLVRDEKGRLVEEAGATVDAERSALADETRTLGAPTVRDVHNLARDRNIPVNNSEGVPDAGFMSFTKRHVGEYHLDEMSPEQLAEVYSLVSSMPVQDTETSLQIAPDDKAVALVKSKMFSGKNARPVTVNSVAGALGLNESVDESTREAMAQGYIDKMTSLGLIRVNSKGKLVASHQGSGVNPKKYSSIISRVRETGSFPTRKEMRAEFGVHNARSYDSILAKALAQGEIERSRGKYVAKALTVGDSGGFRVEVDGVAQDTVYATAEDAELAAEAEYDADNQAWTSSESLGGRLRVAGSLLRRRKVGDVRIVEQSGVRGSDVVEDFGYEVERAEGKPGKGKRGGRWVVRDLAGNISKHFRTSAEAKAFKSRRDKDAHHFEVEVDGAVLSRHKTARAADKAMRDWREAEAGSRLEKPVVSGVPGPELGVAADKAATEAREMASAGARNAARRRGLKKTKVPDGSNLRDPSLEDGFVVVENRVGEGGKKASAPVGFFETESEALRSKRDLDAKRVGRESFGGKIARKGSARASEEMKAKRENPEAWAESQIPSTPAEESRAEWLDKLQNALERVLKDRGLSTFRINLVDALELDPTGEMNAQFVAASNTLNLSLTVDMEGMSLEEQVSSLSPYLRHEVLHGLRRLGLIKPGEWVHLEKWVSTTVLPKPRLELLNAGRSDPFPETTTYLDYAKIVYGNQGSRRKEKADLAGELERGQITEEAAAAELEKIEASEWIEDSYVEEAVAVALEDWPKLEPGDPKPGRVRAILRRIAKTIRQIGNALNGLGFNTQEDVISRVYGGDFSERVARGKALDLWYMRRGETRKALFASKSREDAKLARLVREKESREAVAKALAGGATAEEAALAGEQAGRQEGSELDEETLAALESESLDPQVLVQDDDEQSLDDTRASRNPRAEAIDSDGVSYISRPRKSFSEYREDHPGMLSHEEWVNSDKVKNKNIADKGGALSLFDLDPGALVDARLDLTNLVPIEGETIANSSGEQVPLKGFIAQVHDMKPGDGDRHSLGGGDAKQSGRGPGLAYYPVIVLENATFETDSVGQQRIAKGKSQKFPHSSVRGNISPTRVEDVDYSGLEVTYNPRDSHLYVTADGRRLAVKSAERAVIADGNQNPDAPAGKVIPQNARVILQGKVEFWKEGEAPALPDGAAESGAKFFDEGTRSSKKPTPSDKRADSSQHLMNVKRGKRLKGKVTWARGERGRITSEAKRLGMDEKKIRKYVEGRKKEHPPEGGWIPWVYKGTKTKKGKIVHESISIPYSYDKTRAGEAFANEGTRRKAIEVLARKVVDAVTEVKARAESGDQQAETILRQSTWYREMRRRIRREFGGFGDLFADLLGATSPNTPVKMNWESAVEALRLATNGHYDSMVPGWIAWVESIEAEEHSILQWVDSALEEGRLELEAIGDKFDADLEGLENQKLTDIKKSKEGSRRWAAVLKLRPKDQPARRAEAEAEYKAWAQSKLKLGKSQLQALRNERDAAKESVENSSKKALTESREFKRRKSILKEKKKLPGTLVPRKENRARFGINSAHVAKTMVHMWRVIKEASLVKGETAPKALNFSGNLIGFRERATIDVWAARFLQRLVQGNRVPSQAEGAVAGAMLPSGETTGQFRFGQDVFSSAVEKIRNDPVLSKDPDLASINDDDLQAIVWFLEKERWAKDDTTSGEGEGGSFEFWMNLEGQENRDRLQELNSIIIGTKYTEDEKLAAGEEIDSLQRLVDRWVGGASIKRSDDVMDNAYNQWLPWAMAAVAENVKSAVYESDSGANIIGSNLGSTQGLYGPVPEESINLEFVTRQGFDPRVLSQKIVEVAKEADQESVFLSRVLREGEDIDPLFHRPGIEVYFREPMTPEGYSQIQDKFDSVFEGSGYTIAVDPRQDLDTMAGGMPRIVGLRSQYVPEFSGDLDALAGMSAQEIRDFIKGKAIEMEETVEESLSGIPEVSSASVLWHETNVNFRHEYDAILEGELDGDSGRVEGREAGAARGRAWRGRSVREGAQAGQRQKKIGGGVEFESLPGGDAGTRASRRPTGSERGEVGGWRGEEHHKNLGRVGLLGRDGELSFPGDSGGSRIKLSDLHNSTKNTPEAERSVFRAMGVDVRPGVDTNQEQEIYRLQDAFGTTVAEVDAALEGWLEKAGWEYRLFGPKAGDGGRPVWPRFIDPETGGLDPSTLTYEDGVAWIFDPAEEAGNFRNYAYSLAWRVTHEVAHGLTNEFMTMKYGNRGRRSGALGIPIRGPFHKTDEFISLAGALRALDWEVHAFEVQRKILEDEFGIEITDAEFNKENSLNVASTVYRLLSGQFSNPGDIGVLGTNNDPQVQLDLAKDVLRQAARETYGGVEESFDRSLGGIRHSRNPNSADARASRNLDRTRDDHRGDPRWRTSIVRSQRPVVELPYDLHDAIDKPGQKNNVTWGWFNFDINGKNPKGGRGSRAVVTEGYHQEAGTLNGLRHRKTGFGRRHAEFHDKDLQDNTPYDNWQDMLSDFFRVHAASNKKLSTGYIYQVVNGNYAAFLWDDPGFKHPITLIFSGELIGETEVFMFVTAYPAERYDTYSGSPDQAKGLVPTHGPALDAKTMATYARPAVAKAFKERQRIGPSDRRSIFPSGGSKAPEITRAADNLWGKSRHDGRTFWDHLGSGWKYFNSEEWWDSIRSKYLDKYRAIYRQGKRAGQKKMDAGIAVLADTSAYAAALMSDKAGGFLSAAFKYGIITYRDGITTVEDLELKNTVMASFYDPATKTLVRRRVTHEVYEEGQTGGLVPILNPASSPEENLVEELFLYSAALRSFRLKTERGISPPMSMADILVGLDLVNKHPEIAVIHANMQAWNNGTVEFLIATGVVTREMGDAWMESVDYLPFYLNLESETTGMQQAIIESVLGQKVDYTMIGSLVGAKPAKKITGMSANQKIIEPVEAISLNTMAAITSGLNNVAVQRSVRDALLLKTATQVAKSEGDDVISVRMKGKEMFFKLDDPLLHHALVGTMEGSNPLVEFLGGPARMLREVVTRSPEFMVANMLRDSLSVWTVNGGKFPPVIGTFRQFGKNLKEWQVDSVTKEYEILEKSGSIGGYDMGRTTPKALHKFITRKVHGDKGGLPALRKAWDILGEGSARSESATRELVYNQTYDRIFADLIDANVDRKVAARKAQGEAAFQAMEVLNFSRRGNSVWLKFLTATVPFMNARLQGLDVLARTMSGEHAQLPGQAGRVLTSIAARAALLSSMTFAYALMMHDDEEYQNLRPEIKDDYWHIPIYGTGFLSIPIPFEAGVLFKVIPQKMAELMLGGTTRDASNSMKHALISTLNFSPVPQAVKPILEIMTNHNFFTGRKIVPFYMENMDDAYQSRPGTGVIPSALGGEIAQTVTGGLSPSPLEWQNLLSGYLGGMGMIAMSVVDSVVKTAVPGIPGKPLPRATDMMFAHRFFRDEFGGGLKAQYYELRNEIDGITTTVNHLSKSDPKRASAYRRDNAQVLGLKSVVKKIDKRMKVIRDERTRVMLSTTMGAVSKRERLDALERSENMLLRVVPRLRKSAYMNIDY